MAGRAGFGSAEEFAAMDQFNARLVEAGVVLAVDGPSGRRPEPTSAAYPSTMTEPVTPAHCALSALI